MKDIDILMPEPLSQFIVERLDADYRLHKLWLAENKAKLLAQVKDNVRVLVTSHLAKNVGAEMLGQFPKLGLVAHHGVGYDMVDAKWAGAHGITVTNTPDVLTDEVADLAMGLTLATIRELPQADKYLRTGKWLDQPFHLTASIRGRTMGILGLGRIGKAIAKRAEAFGVKVVYHGRTKQDGVSYQYYPRLIDMAKYCDILMVVAPGSAETKNIVNAEIMAALGGNGILINIARGSLVDEKALIDALQNKIILSAGLDVFAAEPNVPAELIAMDNVVLLPHVGSGSELTRQEMGQLVIDNIARFLNGQAPLTPVPETPWK